MNKLISCSEAVNRIESGMRIMLGGFFYSGLPMHLVRALTARKGQLHDLIADEFDGRLGDAAAHRLVRDVLLFELLQTER